jgi:hypothetical protein
MTEELWRFFGLLFSITVAFGAIGLLFYLAVRLPFVEESSTSEGSESGPRIGPD